MVEIKGDHFDATVRIRFNGRWVRILSRDPGRVKVKIPRNAVTDHFVLSKAGFPDITSERQFVVVRPPRIKGFMPRRGVVGTRVKIRGRFFIPGDRFVIGSVELRVVKRRPHRVVVEIPAGARSGRLGVKRGGHVSAWSRRPFDVLAPPPVVTGFGPRRGVRGTVVRIQGHNLEPTDQVVLNGRRLPTRARGATFIEVVIGRHTTGRFVVVGRMGRRALAEGIFVVIRPPAVRGFRPRYGAPGTRITVFGRGFIEGDQLFIGGGMLTIRTLSDRQIVAELPAGIGSGPVYVRRGVNKYRARGMFEVVHPPVITDLSPRSAPPGAMFVVRGRNFLPGATVLLAGVKLPVVRRRVPHELVVRLPPRARSGEVVVVTRGGSARSPVQFKISHYAILRSIFPLHGLPGTRITLRGQSFHPGMRVLLGNRELRALEIAPSTAHVEIPAGATTGRIVLVSYGRKMISNFRFVVDKPKPVIEFTFAPITGRRGSEVTLFLTPARQGVMVYFDGRPLPKKTLAGGSRVVVTIPGDARTGYFELELEGKRYRAKRPFRVR